MIFITTDRIRHLYVYKKQHKHYYTIMKIELFFENKPYISANLVDFYSTK